MALEVNFAFILHIIFYLRLDPTGGKLKEALTRSMTTSEVAIISAKIFKK